MPFPVCLTGDIDDGHESIEENLKPLLRVLELQQAPMTIPVTSASLHHHHDKIGMLKDAGLEIAGHGDVHAPFRESLDIQLRRLQQMCEDFKSYLGFRPTGFRAPFLEHNADTYAALAASDFQYDSSRRSVDPWLYTKAAFGKAIAFPLTKTGLLSIWAKSLLRMSSSRPYLVNQRVVELPVLDLDDWFFLDSARGPRVAPADWIVIANQWLSTLATFQERNGFASMLVLQAHPARMHRGILRAIEQFVKTAEETGCEFLTLSQLRNRICSDPTWRARNRLPPWWVRLGNETT